MCAPTAPRRAPQQCAQPPRRPHEMAAAVGHRSPLRGAPRPSTPRHATVPMRKPGLTGHGETTRMRVRRAASLPSHAPCCLHTPAGAEEGCEISLLRNIPPQKYSSSEIPLLTNTPPQKYPSSEISLIATRRGGGCPPKRPKSPQVGQRHAKQTEPRLPCPGPGSRALGSSGVGEKDERAEEPPSPRALHGLASHVREEE